MSMNSDAQTAAPLEGFSPSAAPASAPAAAPPVFDVSTATFMTDVIDASRDAPVIVDFWAPWCGPCKTLGPVIERVVAEQGGKVRLAKMDIEAHPEVAGQMGIQSIPAVVAFVDGRPAEAFMGAEPEPKVRAFVEKIAALNVSPADEQAAVMLEAAKALEANSDWGGAAEAYGRMAQANPADLEALAGLVRVYVAVGELDQARQILDTIPEAEAAKDPIAAAAKSLELAKEAESLDGTADLKAAVDANPSDLQARFDYAVALNAAGNRDEAAAQLVEAYKIDPEWNEGAHKAKLLEFFEAWGFKDPASVSGRRKLSSALFK